MADGKRQPWMKWYPADWRGEPRLKLCSLSARGLWADIISYCHEGDPYGHFVIEGEPPAEPDGIAALVGRPAKEVVKALAELDRYKVFARTDKGVIYSRRMVRDKAKAEQDRENGKRGGNPKVKAPDNGGVNPQDKAQIPDAITSEEGSVASATDAAASPGTILDLTAELWKRAKTLLGKHGVAEKQAGSLIGKWLKNLGPPDAETRLLHILASAEAHCRGNIVEYVTAAIARGTGTRKTAAQERADDIRSAFVDEHFSAYGAGDQRDRPGDQAVLPAPKQRDHA